jgi:transcriptional regulator with XRE-family HTH domain
MVNKDIGDSLRMKRLQYRLSQTAVAEQSGISQQLLSSIENNEREFSSELIQRIANTIDVLTGQASKDKVLERIAHIVSETPFPRGNGEVFYWQGHVEGDGVLIFTYRRNKVELWESHFPQDEAALRDGITLFRFELRVMFEDLNGKRASFLLKRSPDPEELKEDFRDMGIATPLLSYLAGFISKWYVTPGIKESE